MVTSAGHRHGSAAACSRAACAPAHLHPDPTPNTPALQAGWLSWGHRRTTCPARSPRPARSAGSATPTGRFSSCLSARTTSSGTAAPSQIARSPVTPGIPVPRPIPAARPGLALLSTMNEVMATTTMRRPGRSGSGSADTIPHRAIRTLRYVSEELVRASQAMSRSARTATCPRAGVPAGKMAAQFPLPNALTGPPGLQGSPPVQPGVVAGPGGRSRGRRWQKQASRVQRALAPG